MTEISKRKADDHSALIKRTKTADGTLIKVVKRTSSLLTPIMLLQGHENEVYSCKFSPDGQHLATSSMDRHIFLWNVHGDCTNYGLLKGHKSAILEIRWSRDGKQIFSASADKTVAIYNSETGQRDRRLVGHTSHVNAVSNSLRGTELLASVADDGFMRVWDMRTKHSIFEFKNDLGVPLTAVDWSRDGGVVFVGGLDNTVKAYDVRNSKVIYSLEGHGDTITGLRTSPDGTTLLSNAMDNTLRIWDIKPFSATSSRMIKKFEGAAHGFEKNLIKPCWSPDGDFIACGSGDRSLVVWETLTRKIVYKLPGHKGCVNEVDWNPKEPILASCSNDKTIFLGEIDTEDI